MRLYNEIIDMKYHWEGMIEDCKEHEKKYLVCLQQRGENSLYLQILL